MSPAPRRVKTIAGHVLIIDCVVKERKILSIVYDYFKALIINLRRKVIIEMKCDWIRFEKRKFYFYYCPEADITVVVSGNVRK